MKLLTTILMLCACTAVMSAQAESDVNATSFLTSINSDIPGELSLEFKSIVMGRNRGDQPGKNDEHASTSGFELGYVSDDYAGFSFGAKYITSWVNYEGGNRQTAVGPASSLSIGRFDILNEGYVQYTFAEQGMDKTYLRAGRQVLNLNFVRGYNIRQKDQAFEGVVFHSQEFDNLAVTAGHLEKYSSWSSRDFFTGANENRFVDIARVEGVNYDTNGIQFVELTYSGLDDTKLSFYDYYADDLYNTLGIHVDHSFHFGGWEQVVKGRFIAQQDVGIFPTPIESRAYQLGLQFKKDDFSFEAGSLKVIGTGPQNNVLTPYAPNLIVEEPMFETDLGFTGGSLNLYVESSFSWGSNGLYLLLLNSDGGQAGISNTEFDLIYGHDFNDSLYFKFKFAYSKVDTLQAGGNDPWVTDYRFFFGYRF